MKQRVVHKHQCHHRFRDGSGPDANTGIMTSIRLNRHGIALLVDRAAGDSYARRWLDADRDDDILTSRNTSQNAASVIRDETLRRQFVTML